MRKNGIVTPIVTKTVTKVREGFAAAGRRQKGTRRWYTHPHLTSPRLASHTLCVSHGETGGLVSPQRTLGFSCFSF